MSEKSADQLLQSYTLTEGCVGEKNYEIDDTFRPGKQTFHGVHTVAELVKLVESDPKIDVEGIFLAGSEKGEHGAVRLNKTQFLEKWKRNAQKRSFKKVIESFNGGGDYFQNGRNLIGDDYTPLMGGPFNKQLYLHDALRMFALAFHASNHDPIAKALINITVDFTLGRGYRVDSKDKKALALWRAFEKVNKLPEIMRHIAYGLSRDGEVMVWWLPNGQTFQLWQDNPGQIPDPALIPRIKLIDPSTCWEIITYPEDIDRVIAYQLVYPTQYNIYSAKTEDGSQSTSSKFIMQQIPADQVMHFRVNRSSNEKRGRSDLYPIFGYLKRLRDTVEYSVVAMAKAAAWAIDTTIDGSLADIQNYLADQQQKKTIAPAGSEFIHSTKIKRDYIGNNATKNGGSVSAFEWCLNMICAAVQIPVSYLGTHLSGGQTKASAMVGTEPVTKKFEARQNVYVSVVQEMWDYVMKCGGLEAKCEITFPELISQDRSAKIKDLVTAQEVDAISHEYMSTSIAQELGNTSYDYQETQAKIKTEKASQVGVDADNILISPLTAKVAPPSTDAAPKATQVTTAPSTNKGPSKVTKGDRAQQRRNDTN